MCWCLALIFVRTQVRAGVEIKLGRREGMKKAKNKLNLTHLAQLESGELSEGTLLIWHMYVCVYNKVFSWRAIISVSPGELCRGGM